MSIYYSFKWYIKRMHDTFLLRHRYVNGLENVPAPGERYFIVCNHQNTGNDPLNILFALPFHLRTCAMARADLFEIRPFITRFLHWVGMVPAFRFGWEGADGIENNYSSFDQVAERVNAGSPLIVFPEAGHTQGHYLGRFTSGSVRIAFHVAKQNGWQEDVKILPTATHYSDYFGVQHDLIWSVAPAISLKPYYEEYQQHPSSVMRKVTHQLHETVCSMMLDEGKQDYEVKDFLRLSHLHPAHHQAANFSDQLQADQAFAARLNAHPQYAEIIAQADQLRQEEQRLGVTDAVVEAQPGWSKTLLQALLMLVLLPLWVVNLWPHALCYAFPFVMLKTDRMFTNTYRYVFATLFFYPLGALITLLTLGLGFGWWLLALLWIALWGPISRFEWGYYQHLKRLKSTFCYLFHRQQMSNIQAMRQRISQLLDD